MAQRIIWWKRQPREEGPKKRLNSRSKQKPQWSLKSRPKWLDLLTWNNKWKRCRSSWWISKVSLIKLPHSMIRDWSSNNQMEAGWRSAALKSSRKSFKTEKMTKLKFSSLRGRLFNNHLSRLLKSGNEWGNSLSWMSLCKIRMIDHLRKPKIPTPPTDRRAEDKQLNRT